MEHLLIYFCFPFLQFSTHLFPFSFQFFNTFLTISILIYAFHPLLPPFRFFLISPSTYSFRIGFPGFPSTFSSNLATRFLVFTLNLFLKVSFLIMQLGVYLSNPKHHFMYLVWTFSKTSHSFHPQTRSRSSSHSLQKTRYNNID